MTNFKVISKQAQTRIINEVPVEGFVMRVILAPNSGNRESLLLFGAVAFVTAEDPIASLNVNDVFDLSL